MASALTLHRTTIGKKALVAVTGLILFGFVIGHLAGNLLVFVGPEALNAYAHGLKTNPPLLWGTRIVVLSAVVIHIALTMSLAGQNAGARKSRYKKKQDQVTSYAARTMVLSGPLLLAYILFHLAHFTVPGLDLGGDFDPVNVWGNVVRGFRVWWVAAIYIFANILLGLHLYHGAWSALQSVGANHPKYEKIRRRVATGIGVAIAVGNIAIPVTILSGLVGTDAQLAASDADPLGEHAEAEIAGVEEME